MYFLVHSKGPMYEYGEKERNLQKCFKASDKLCRKYKRRIEKRTSKADF